MSDEIFVGEFKGLTDMPAFDRDPGFLRTLRNLRPRPGGLLEMRGGLERLKPTIGGVPGTPANPAIVGAYLGAIDSATPWGWLQYFRSGLNSFSGNLILGSYFPLFFGAVGDYIVFGADQPFSTATLTIGLAAVFGGGTTFRYEYGTTDTNPPGNAANYSVLTTSTTFDFTTAAGTTGRQTTLSFPVPQNWVPTTEGNVGQGFARKYHVRVRLTAVVGWVTNPRHGHENARADWAGGHELYVAMGDPILGGANTGALYRYVEIGNTNSNSWTGIISALNAGNSARWRMVSYRGILYIVNGIDSKRYVHGWAFNDMGLTKPALTFNGPGTILTAVPNNPPGTTWTAGAAAAVRFRYAVTAGWGSQQVSVPRDLQPAVVGGNTAGLTFAPTLLGESQPQFFTTAQYPLATAGGVGYVNCLDGDCIRFDINPASMPNFEVDALHFYRTDDLTNVPPESYETMPYFRKFSIYRDPTTGTFLGGNYYDQLLQFPFPRRELDQEDTTPPTHCKFVWIHKNRLFYANSDRFPARVWWSDPYEPDIVHQDVNYEDFSTVLGGRVTSAGEFLNMSIVFTEDQMYGISDVDVDQFQSFPIAPGIGCIAADSFKSANGLAIWLAKDGFYAWNGEGLPRKISQEMDDTFSRMSFEGHGLSKAEMHTNQYEIRMIDLKGVHGLMYRFDLITGKWFEVLHAISAQESPLCNAVVPLGHADYPRAHPIYGCYPTALFLDQDLLVGEWTTQDKGSNITCTADIHFGPMGRKLFTPDIAGAYYKADGGWGVPVLSEASTSAIGTDIPAGGVGSGTPDTGADYAIVEAGFKQTSTGSQDIVVRFQVASAAAGTLYRQRLLAAFLTGSYTDIRRP